MISRLALRSSQGLALTALAGAGGYTFHRTRMDSGETSLVVPTLEASLRAARLLQTTALIVYDYQMHSWFETNTHREQERDAIETELQRAQEVYTTESHQDLSPTERLEAKRHEKQAVQEAAEKLASLEVAVEDSRHVKPAQRLLQLCRTNGGVYIKVGQHLANLDYLIPQEYIRALSELWDDAPQTSYENVRAVIREELGEDPEVLFDSFDPEPLASASLAQVHVAYKDGQKLAVKVQHRGLKETSVGDINALVSVVRWAERWFDGFTWGWMADEIAPHLPKELNFVNEGNNAERAASAIAKTGLNCVIPKVLWDKTSARVLTMEFEEGFKATDVGKIDEAGLKKVDVAKLISSVFASQVFLSAFVHCDPHPANVLLRATKSGKPEMVLVDHGLYRELDDAFRLNYCRLWKNLMLADLKGIKDSCADLGVDETSYTLFAAILTARPFDELIERSKKGSLSTKVNPADKADQVIIRGYAQRFVGKIFELLGSLPRQMLLLLKMNDCLRHIDHALGSPANTLIVSGRFAADALYENSFKDRASWFKRWECWVEYMRMVVRIQIYEIGARLLLAGTQQR